MYRRGRNSFNLDSPNWKMLDAYVKEAWAHWKLIIEEYY